ncbi:ATP phosphoribosyltransferase regulatory subunit, partial [Salmonella enterica subsp. enterica]
AAVVDGEGLSDNLIRRLHDCLAQKDRPALEALLAEVSAACKANVLALLSLYGSVGGSNCVLNRAAETLPRNPKVGAVLNELRTLIARLQET